jgi:hypothetical protein
MSNQSAKSLMDDLARNPGSLKGGVGVYQESVIAIASADPPLQR